MATFPVSIDELGPTKRAVRPQVTALEVTPEPSRMGQLESCSGCAFFVADDAVTEQLPSCEGYGVCAVSGRLLETGDIGDMQTSTQCPFATLKTNWSGPEVAPLVFTVDVGKTNAPAPAAAEEQAPPPVPVTRDVSEDEAAFGIDKWELIPIPTMLKDADQQWLPVFGNIWDMDETSLIPKAGNPHSDPALYVDHAGLAHKMMAAWQQGYATCFFGDAGVGKTAFAEYLAWKMNVPFVRIGFTAESSLDDIAGVPTFKDGETGFELGRMSRWFNRPCVMLLDEPNLAPPVVQQWTRSALDGGRQLTIEAADGGVVVPRHEFNMLCAAQNPPWDMRYRGANEASSADAERMASQHVPYPEAAVEKDLIKRALGAVGVKLTAQQLKVVMKISEDMRRACDPLTGSLLASWGIRPNIMAAKLIPGLGVMGAYEATVINRLEPDAGEVVRQVIKTHVPGA